ncbi:hypothetical protein [Denitromonas iodatirespirans]|uniref:Uncharacterized protein n=1 Tax=Denitromonas iodatirespirans TaxID=2795389 RepID=A0A944DK33_DENI1|nr:hypothetical protein [Denitromonas iodatirespirans]MBT0960244.1 hypothetical protein [Denitromonas iodatirespirans]
MPNDIDTIDLSLSWSQFGVMYARFAESGECAVVAAMRNDLAKAMAAAQALRELSASLTAEQLAKRDMVFQHELANQLAAFGARG